MSIGSSHALIRQVPDIATQIPEFDPDPAATPRLDLLHDPVPVQVTISENQKNVVLGGPVRWRVREIVRERPSPETMIFVRIYS